MSIQVDIDNALTQACVDMFGDLPFIGIPVQYPNRKLDPTPEQYIQVVQFRNNQQNYAWSVGTDYPGILQINVIGAPDVGSIPALDLAATIAGYFPKGRDLRSGAVVVKIEVEPEILSPLPSGQNVTVPVSIRYRCFA